MKAKHFIINTEEGNVNFEWVNGKSHPESFWLSKEAKVMTERQKDYISNLIVENHTVESFLVIEVC